METIIHGDCLEELKKLPENSVDSICTDPPYGLSFMGKHWDYDVPSIEIWQECLRVLKPGGHLLSFAGTRTQHRMAVRIEDAGFEIRDMIAWVYGSGFPKSLDISKAIDKRGGNASLTKTIGEALKKARESRGVSKAQADQMFCNGTTNYSWFEGRPAGQRPPTPQDFEKICAEWPELKPLADMVAEAEREVIGKKENQMSGWNMDGSTKFVDRDITIAATDQAKKWEGWGTALKPALEPITVARKPLIGTVAENVLTHGTGGINIGGCRVGTGTGELKQVEYPDIRGDNYNQGKGNYKDKATVTRTVVDQGRWPANLIHDGSEEVLECFPNESHRFFYSPKASKKDRDEGLEGFEEKNNMRVNAPRENEEEKLSTLTKNHHPTVKPTALMRYLVKLVTPPGGTVLDPFTGSGSTGKACKLEGFDFIGIEREEEYVNIAKARIEAVSYKPTLL